MSSYDKKYELECENLLLFSVNLWGFGLLVRQLAIRRLDLLIG